MPVFAPVTTQSLPIMLPAGTEAIARSTRRAPRRVCALPEVIVNTKEVFGPRRHFRRGLE